MPLGTARREGGQNSLAGYADVQPASLQGPGVMNPRAIQPPASMQNDIIQQLARWGGEKLAVAANTQNEKDYLDGAVAYQQGVALDDLQIPGNKWMQEGHMFMDAQVSASTLMAAQQVDIEQSSYSTSPDEFRAKYVNRMDALLQGKDPHTAEMVREQMTKQMPSLIAQHTTAYATYNEKQNFESLERSIDVVSRDPTATSELISFAQGGPDSPSSGLSKERRDAAVVSGVLRAFENDNPLAFSALKGAGLLGDTLTTDQQNQLRGAQSAFEGRRRSEYNSVLFDGEKALMASVEHNDLTPSQAVEELSLLYADHGIKMNAADAGQIYTSTEENGRIVRATRGALLEDAGLRGDADAEANIIIDSLTTTESGGNAQAHRTNNDGRSFSGLLQIGQGRLDDYANAMGTGSITVEQFGALSAADQRSVNQWHIKDLVSAAKATGAIGSTINGVTVTLSGLVAVGHLGGTGGMQKFVSSGGEYNPADQLGTSLTDYLSKHGSGEMQELNTPGQRYESAVAKVNQTREALALSAYEAMAPEQAKRDMAFKTGTMPEAEWKRQNDAAYRDYGVARTKADIDREISTSQGVANDIITMRDGLAKTAGNETRVANLDAAHSALLTDQATFDAAMQNKDATPEELSLATKVFQQARAATLQAFGIAPSAQGNSAAQEGMYKTLSASMERNRAYREQGVQIDAAINGGYLGDLPKDQQQRAFKTVTAGIIKDHTDAVANKTETPAQANAGVAEDINTFFAQSGAVDPTVKSQMSAAILGPLVDKDGNPNPNVVDAVTQYASVKAMNPRAATAFLSDEATVLAEAVIARSADPSQFNESVRNLGVSLSGRGPVEDTLIFMQRQEVQASITREVDAYLDTNSISIAQGIWRTTTDRSQAYDRTGADTDALNSDEMRTKITSELSEEVSRLQRVNPNLKPSDISSLAAQRLDRRTALIGGDMVMLNPGQDMGTAMFGSKANDFMQDGTVNTAIVEWLRSDEVATQYGFTTGSTMGERLPGWVQSVGDAAAGVFGSSFTPALTMSQSYDMSSTTQVRPFQTWTTADGKGVALRVLKPDGNYSEAIVVPMRHVGDMYMQRRRAEAVDPNNTGRPTLPYLRR